MIRSRLLLVGLVALAGCDKEEAAPAAPTAKASTALSAAPSATAVATAAPAAPTAEASAAPEVDESPDGLPPHYDGAVVAPLEGLDPPPTDWEGGSEVTVFGSSKANCKTVVLGSWFLCECETVTDGESELGRMRSAAVVEGLHRGQTTLEEYEVGEDEEGRKQLGYRLVTPYAEGIKLVANFQWHSGYNIDLTIEWPKGEPAPKPTGKLLTGPDRREQKVLGGF